MPLLGDLTIGKYVEADSPLHRLDPRTKFLAALALAVGILRSREPAALLACALLLGAAVALSHGLVSARRMQVAGVGERRLQAPISPTMSVRSLKPVAGRLPIFRQPASRPISVPRENA